MAAGRTLKSLMSRRRRTEDEGEDEDGPVLVDDSQSEGSAVSEPEDDDDDGSASAAPSRVEQTGGASAQGESNEVGGDSMSKKAKKARKKGTRKPKDGVEQLPTSQSSFKVMADTEAMMNGLRISDQPVESQEAIDFESMDANGIAPAPVSAPNGHAVSAVAKQRQEHEEYKKKRDSDPSFIPNRGNFFMHDTRGQPNGQVPPPRGAWQARGRGRGGPVGANVGGPFSPANQMAQAERAAEQPWKHDLHEVINQDPAPQVPGPKVEYTLQDQQESSRLFPKVAPQIPGRERMGDLVKTTLLGKVQIRVLLDGMKEPIVFPNVPWKSYLRLAEPRPSLRRDKPVRILLPGFTASKYQFPQVERSFIFIPRTMRPNQRGGRGNYQRSIGGYGYSSRRTSMYSGSVAASRRSSIAGLTRDHTFSPPGSVVGMPTGRPPVRLPYPQHFSAGTTPLGPLSGHHTPVGMPQIHTYPLPQQPMKEGIPATEVHHPLPQKTISVTGIESPLQQQAANDALPFQNQLPSHLHEQAGYQQPPPAYFSPRQPFPYAQLPPQTGTPLSGIPEQAIHAPSFHPPAYGQPPPPFYPPYQMQQGFYYPPQAPHGYPGVPMYMPPPQQGFMAPPQPPPPAMSAPPPPPPQSSQPSEEHQRQHQHRQQPSQSGMVAREDRGMVFYVPASEVEQPQQYQPAESFVPSWAITTMPPPEPASDNPMPYYPYPQMQPAGMQEVGNAVYYPTQPQQ